MRLQSVLMSRLCPGRRLRLCLANTLVLSGLACLCLSSQWWTNGHPDRSVSPAQYRGPYIYHHDQTLALLYFQPDGERTAVQPQLRSLLSGQQISECRLILAEYGDSKDKIQLLNHFSQRMPVTNCISDDSSHSDDDVPGGGGELP